MDIIILCCTVGHTRYAWLLHCHIAILSHRMWKPAAATLLTLLLQSRLLLSRGYVSVPGGDYLVSKFQRMSAPNSSRKASHDQSSFSNHPKKRLRPEAETGQDNSAMDMKFIQKLRLEAIFHPKFENENSNQEIRSKMLDLVAAQKGYLEVTLKHSGSLVLWSGGQRFYSKNSLSNQFTLVAEILLRQHMERAWRNVDGTGVEKYDQLSRFLSNRRLNVAFEVVTSVLGDHGDIPNKDFLIVTAIADRSKERFLSTTETLELCQKFRLPHNDVWTFTSGAQDLFLLYDCCRETGLATDTIDSLSESAQAHIVSMYPHTAFQGDILEGFIIRYIGYPQEDQVRSMQERLRAMAETAQKIFAEVPSSLPTSFEISNLESPVLQTDVRKVFDQVDGPLLGIKATEAFVEALNAVISSQDGETRRKAVKARVKNYDLPSATKALTLSDDKETRRLAEMLQTLGSLNKAINYTVVEEYLPSCSARTLCIINVHHDKTFRKYQKEKDANTMNLFRGFCIELGDASHSSLNDAEVSEMESEEQDNDDGPFLMLKMKLLPYMIRTFLCRNKLDLIQQNGPEAFVANASKQLESWSISPQAKAKWLPFLQEWAIYAKGQLEGTLVSKDLPSLSSFSYLRHLNRFQTQYDSGELPTLEKYTKNNFSGFVYVISLTEAVAKTAADSIAQHLGCQHVMALRDAVKQCKMRAVVCHGKIHDYNNAVKQFLVDVQTYSTLVLIGCSENDIETEYENIKEQKGTKAKCSRWKEQPSPLSCIILPKSTNLDTNAASPEDSGSTIEVIKEAAKKAPWNGAQWDSRPGVLVFFLGIPGCGKSSLLGSKEDLFGESMLIKASNSTEKDRKIDIFVGDELGKNMWNVVTRHRSKESPSAITIMDKNTPPPSWPIVGQLCSSTRATPLAVFPDASSLKTTRIIGMRMPDGSFNPDRSHFYPFSLEYFALSMARVLERPSGTHKGKLDSGTEMAAMIVVKFYSFYRYKAADSLRDDIDRQLKANGALDSLPPMEVPVLKEDNVALPAEVSEVLKEALQLQLGYDVEKPTGKKEKDAILLEMDSRLKKIIRTHREILFGQAVQLDQSRAFFKDQLEKRISLLAALDNVDDNMECDVSDVTDTHGKPKIKLVSLDISKKAVHTMLKREAVNGPSGDFLKILLGERFLTGWDKDHFSHSNFVEKTHVTLDFWTATTQESMQERFGHLIGSSLRVEAVALLWDDLVAAVKVKANLLTEDGKTVPQERNEFLHITIWVADGARAWLSNKLPNRFNAGQAQRVLFAEPQPLLGTISFWDFENNVLT